ncbi:MAG TPA: SPOR domain-containing protein [Prolixibacteraceae bacterium]|nr:SPOR domain-containing protein [Prolixibacteraceae bacterium]
MNQKRFLPLLFLLFLGAISSSFAQSHYLVVYSSSQKNLAEKKADQLKAGGFVSSGLFWSPRSKNYRVYLNSYPSRELAERDLERYREKYPGAWILGQSSTSIPEPAVESARNSEEIEELKIELDQNRKQIGNLLDELSELKIALQSESAGLYENSMEKNMSILALEEKIQSFTARMEELKTEQDQANAQLIEKMVLLEEDYRKKIDSLASIRYRPPVKKERGRAVLSFSLGMNQTHILSPVDTALLHYLTIDERNYSNTFWGFHFGADYHVNTLWSFGADFQSYVYYNNYYLLPSLNGKLHIRFRSVPVSLLPSLALGTELMIPKTGKGSGGRYVLFRPGMELEWALSKTVSFFGGAFYHFNGSFQNMNYQRSPTQHMLITMGLRLNVTQAAEP